MHCPKSPDLWQVGVSQDDEPNKYFIVRWRPPYRFTMVETRDNPRPECTEEDPEADERKTLFLH